MRYLITGGAGFIGSHLAERILGQGDSVIVFDDFSTGTRENIRLLEGNERFRLVYGNMSDRLLVAECVQEADRVYHLASAVGVKMIVEKPVETIETMVEGASNVLSACARCRTPVLLTSSSEVYGKSEALPFSENADSIISSPGHHRWAYAVAKSLSEFLALAYWRQSNLPVVLVRLFNTVGPKQTGRYGMVVPRLIRQALDGENLSVYGDGTQTRCFCHVQDAVTALVALLDKPECAGEVFNVGSAEQVSINELAKRIIQLTGSTSKIRHVPYEEVYGQGFEDMRHRVPSLDKIYRCIGFRPTRNLTAIIRDIIESQKETA